MISLTKKLVSLLPVAVLSVSLVGCASIVNGENQSISVSTPPVQNATCTLENNKGKWYVSNTPGSVTVNRSYNDLHINCQKKGYLDAQQTVASHTKGMAFGNVLFGGVIGAGVDMADGAAYDYPSSIELPMQRGA